MPVDKRSAAKTSKPNKLVNIAGCDYSAAVAQPNATWIACGSLADLKFENSPVAVPASSILTISSLENIGSDKLLDYLLRLKDICATEPRQEEAYAAGASAKKQNAEDPSPARPSSGSTKPDSGFFEWIIGLDFPFSFPRPFAEILLGAKPLSNWVNFAEIVSRMTFAELLAEVKAAKPIMGGEVKRLTDNSTDPKAQSPLHQINPGMLKMTWQGMHLLLALHKQGFAILPLATANSFSALTPNSLLAARLNTLPAGEIEVHPAEVIDGHPATAIEVYPAAVLKSLGLPWRKYKGNAPEAKQLRQFILNNLTGKGSPGQRNPAQGDKLRSVNRIAIGIPELALAPNLEQLALANDDALDAVIAALGAAIAYLNPGQTAPPRQISTDLIALEGWIYVPHP